MYYVVFTTLRLIVLFVKGVVSRVINMMNNLPVFALITAFFRPDLIPGGIKFEYVNSLASPEAELNTLQDFPLDITGPLPTVFLILHNQPLPITKLFTQQLLDKYPDQDEYKQDWLPLVKKLAKGELIYPWVKSRTFKKEATQWLNLKALWERPASEFVERRRDICTGCPMRAPFWLRCYFIQTYTHCNSVWLLT